MGRKGKKKKKKSVFGGTFVIARDSDSRKSRIRSSLEGDSATII